MKALFKLAAVLLACLPLLEPIQTASAEAPAWESATMKAMATGRLQAGTLPRGGSHASASSEFFRQKPCRQGCAQAQ